MTVDLHRFTTGAVRSTDADGVRYDLITPIGLREVARVYAPGFWSPFGEEALGKSTSWWLGHAKALTSQFLGGERGNMLPMATMCVLEAIQNEENADWQPPYGELEENGSGFEDIPPAGLRAVARAYAEGLAKYSAYNWEHGMDVASLLNHGLKHIDTFLEGLDTGEDDLGHAAWNFLGAIHSLEMWPHLNTQLRGPGCVPPPQAPAGLDRARPASEGGQCADCDSPFACACEGECLGPMGLSGFFSKRDLDIMSRTNQPHYIPRLNDPRDGSVPPPVLYLSGPMTGIPHFNFPAFNAAAENLRRKGFPVLNPADFGWEEKDWAKNLARDLAMLGYADILVQLPGWELSKGASLEFNTAVSLGKGAVSLAEVLALS